MFIKVITAEQSRPNVCRRRHAILKGSRGKGKKVLLSTGGRPLYYLDRVPWAVRIECWARNTSRIISMASRGGCMVSLVMCTCQMLGESESIQPLRRVSCAGLLWRWKEDGASALGSSSRGVKCRGSI